jgi:uncharacterized membrane protein
MITFLVDYLSVFLVSMVKFSLAFPLAITNDLTFWQTFLISCFGGIFGVLIFTNFTKVILDFYYKLFPSKKIKKNAKDNFKTKIAKKAMKKYGLFGLAFLTPLFLSIPVGTFLALKFYPNKTKTLPVLFASVLGWSFSISIAIYFFV